MTRAQIRKKYGIEQLEHPSIANKELSEKEAETYEKFCKMIVKNFDDFYNDDGSDDPDDVDDESIAKIINDSLENGSDEDQVPYQDPRKTNLHL